MNSHKSLLLFPLLLLSIVMLSGVFLAAPAASSGSPQTKVPTIYVPIGNIYESCIEVKALQLLPVSDKQKCVPPPPPPPPPAPKVVVPPPTVTVRVVPPKVTATVTTQPTTPTTPETITVTTTPPPTAPVVVVESNQSIWNCIVQHESGGDPTVMNSQGSGAAGLFQFELGTWLSSSIISITGAYPGGANTAPASVQWAAAEQYEALNGWRAWSGDGCTPDG